MTSRSAKQREPAVAVGSSQRPWVAELMSYAQDHAGVRVVGTVLSSREAVDQAYDVLLIDDTTSYLTKRLIDRVHALRRIVIGVYESTRGETGRSKLVDMGVDAVIDAESSPKDFLARILYLTEQRLVDRGFAEMVAEEPLFRPERSEPSDRSGRGPARSGSLVVVSGTNGVTEVAIGLATAMGGRGVANLLMDLDTIEPVLAQRLGTELSPNVLTAIEGLRHTGASTEVTATHPEGFSIMAGLPSPREWEACRPDDASDLTAELARLGTNLVVRVNRQLEDLGTLWSSLRSFRRSTALGGRRRRVGGCRRSFSDWCDSDLGLDRRSPCAERSADPCRTQSLRPQSLSAG